MADSSNAFATTGRSRKGEPLVWLTAAGLGVGVALTIALLGLVLYKGLGSFWPSRLHEVTHTTDGGTVTTAGFIAEERTRRDMDGEYHDEIQLFRGNAELYGQTFVYLDRSNIEDMSQPGDLWLIERMEGGNAIGRPARLEFADGGTLSADEADFGDHLDRLMEESETLRERQKEIEDDEIGANSRELKELRNQQRIEGESAERTAKIEALQAEYAEFDVRRNEIRDELHADKLVLTAANGEEITITMGDLLHVYAPNQAGFFSRLGETFRRGWTFLTDDPREANTEGGVYPALFGTVVMTIVMSLFVTPFGVIAAIYLREYAKQGPVVRAVRISVNNLAGVPSIVFGVFGLAFFIYFVGGVVDDVFYPNADGPVYKSGGILWASATLALLTVPVVVVATEEALASVPRGMREAALACGASKWQTIQRVVLPASLPGILTGVILAMARGAGEVAPLMLVGVVKSAPDLPIDGTAPFVHPERQFMHLGFHIYDLGFQSPDSEAAKPMVFATTLLLIVLVVLMNLIAIVIRNHLRRKYATSSF